MNIADPNWFDILVPRIRLLKMYDMSDSDVARKIVSEGNFSPEQVWLAIKAAEVLDTPWEG